VPADPGILEPVLGPVTGARGEGPALGLVGYVAHVCADPDCERCVATGRPGSALGGGLPEGVQTLAGEIPGTVALEIEWQGEEHEVVAVFEPEANYETAAALNNALYAAVDEEGTLYVTYQSNGVVHVWRSDRGGGDPAWVEAARFGTSGDNYNTPTLVAWGRGNVAVVATSRLHGVVAFISSSADTSSVSGGSGAMGTFVQEPVAGPTSYPRPKHACVRISSTGGPYVAFVAETGLLSATEIWYAARASGTWTVEGPLDGGAGADFPTLAVTEDPLRLGGWTLLGATVPTYAVIAAWREPVGSGLDQTWYAIRTDLDPWTAPGHLTYQAKPLTGSSTTFTVNGLIDPVPGSGPASGCWSETTRRTLVTTPPGSSRASTGTRPRTSTGTMGRSSRTQTWSSKGLCMAPPARPMPWPSGRPGRTTPTPAEGSTGPSDERPPVAIPPGWRASVPWNPWSGR